MDTKEVSKSENTEDTKNSLQKNTSSFNASQILLVVILILVLMSGIQVFQTQKLLAAVSSGSVRAASTQTQGSSSGLQSQVGGCG